VKRTLPVLAGAAVAAFGALIVGEYELEGVLPVLAGLILGLLVSEAVALGGQWRGWVPAGVAAVLAAAGILWGGWIDSGHGIEPYPPLAWLGAAVAALVAVVRARPPRARAQGRPPPL
jgi:peptidoglycan/LPS O-acetylase OafA/YrhL